MAINPLYPGYYPGKREVRPIRNQGTPSEGDWNEIYNIIDYVAADYDLAGPDLPKWMVERTLDDWKQALKVTIKPESGISQEDLDDYDVGSLEGAFGISVDLNPFEIVKDPEKWAKRTAENWAKSGLNWQDLGTKYRRQIWKNVFEQDSQATGTLEQLASAALGANIGSYAGIGYEPTANPLALKGRDIKIDAPLRTITGFTNQVQPDGSIKHVVQSRIQSTTGQIDVMQNFANSLGDYEVQSQFGPARENQRDKTDHAGLTAIVAEMEQNTAAQNLINTNANAKGAYLTSRAHLDVYNEMDKVGDEFKEYSKSLGRAISKKGTINDRDTKSTRTNVEKSLNNIDAMIADLRAKGMPHEADYLNKYAKAFRKQTEGVLGLAVMDPNQVKKMSALGGSNMLKGYLDGGFNGKPLTGGTTFSSSAPRTLLRNFSADTTRSGIRGYTLGSLVQDVAKQDSSIASRAVMGGMTFVRNSGDINRAMEVLGAIEEGRFLERYVWKKVNAYWQASTPAQYTERFLNKHHYFGLKIGNDDEFEKSVLHSATTIFTGTKDAPGKLFGNWFTVDQTFKGPKDRVLLGVRVSGKIYGGKHFQSVGVLAEIAHLNGWDDPANMNFAAFNKLLSLSSLQELDPSSAFYQRLVALNHGHQILLPTKLDNFNDFLRDIDSFKAWLRKNKHRINVNLTDSDERYYWALFMALKRHGASKDTLGLTKKYAGILEKVFSKLNTLQTRIFNSVLGRIIIPFVYLRKIVADLIAAGLTKIISLVASAASSGVLAPVMAALEPVIRFVVNVVIDKVTEVAGVFYNGIVNADIEGVFKYIDKTVERGTKVAMIIIGFFTMLIVIPADINMGALATTFSPVDNTLVQGVADNFAVGFMRGDGIEVEPAFSRPSSFSCFSFDDYNGIIPFPAMGMLVKWESRWYGLFNEALKDLQAVSGGYIQRLCDASGGKISIAWAADDAPSGPCGYAVPSYNGFPMIILGHNSKCYSDRGLITDWFYSYLFAHETGHIYDFVIGKETIGEYSYAYAASEGVLPTYNIAPGVCSPPLSSSEDFADLIGDMVRINTTCDIGVGGSGDARWQAFWDLYPKHFEYADKVLFREGGLTPTTFDQNGIPVQ